LLAGRNYNAPGAKDARYGFNGKENDNDVKGEGNQQDYGFRIYDPRLGKFLSVDPLTKEYPELTPYQFSSNGPIENIDLDGLESLSAIKDGLTRKFQAQLKVATTPPPVPEKQISMRDVNGVVRTGPKSQIEAKTVYINKNYYDAAVASNISGGVFGAGDYMFNPRGGGFTGAGFDGVLFSFGGFPEKSNISPKRTSTVNPEPARTGTANTPSASTNKQVNAANGKNPTDASGGTIIKSSPEYITVEKDGKIFHINNVRVKEFVPNPKNPKAQYGDAVNFKKQGVPEGSKRITGEESGKGHKRTPTLAEEKMFNENKKE
jgi:RHS repeat-associated protein